MAVAARTARRWLLADSHEIVSQELAELLRDPGLAGARIDWWSSPWDMDPEPMPEAMRHTTSGDVDALAGLLGSYERAHEALATYGAEHLSAVDPALSGTTHGARMVYSFNGGNTWRLRVDAGDGIKRFFYFTARPQ